MKKIMLAFAVVFLVGCSDRAYEMQFPVMPAELSDCKFYHLEKASGANITVARCPNSATTTSYMQGKAKRKIVVIDGVEHVQ
jgi:hypothetical protein